jgi:hypothetical protein
MRKTFKTALLKTLAYWGVFIFFHFAYSWFPAPFVAAFSGTSEGVYQHMKIGFFAYMLVSLVEFFILRAHEEVKGPFWESRCLSTLLIPAVIFFWYLAPAIRGGPMPSDLLEVLYAQIVTLLTGFAVVWLEGDLSTTYYSRVSRWLLGLAFALSAFLFVIITFHIPWGGFFFQ